MRLRLGFLAVSSVVHVLLLMSLILAPRRLPTRPTDPFVPEVPARQARVFLPPPGLLKSLRPVARPTPPPAAPTPPPVAATPPPPFAPDRISIGAPSPVRQKHLLLRPDEDLTAQAKGRSDASGTASPAPGVASPAPVATPAVSQPPSEVRTADARTGTPGLRLPAGLAPGGRETTARKSEPPSLASTLRNLDARLAQEGARGITTGTGSQNTGPLDFDPQGADFTAWINQWKNEVYRNWIVPPSFTLGAKGRVELRFTVERDGRLSAVSVVKSSGTPSLDRAAQNALVSSRLLPLPSDFGPARVTIGVTFLYNMAPE
jgi:TonB family protein